MAKVKVRRFPWPFRLGVGSLHREAVDEVMPPAKTQKIYSNQGDPQRSPKWYMENFLYQQVTELKTKSTLGLTAGAGEYCVLETFVPWGGSSAYPVQRCLNLGDRTSWYRISSNETTWGSWLTVH